jgi:DNA-binding helix-hairpin-helix protein with protein kinase domain
VSEARLRIDSLRKDYCELKPSFDIDIAKIEHSREAAQRRDYLRNEFIGDAVINGIGSNIKNALLSEGIETALDVLTRGLDGISGVGDRRKAALTAWAESVDRAFRFDPKKDVPAVERRAIVARYRQRQCQIKAQLERDVSGLRQLAQIAADDIENVRRPLTEATALLMQAQVDWIAVE